MTQPNPPVRTQILAHADLGRAIIARRIELDVRRSDVAAATGLHASKLRQIETGRLSLSEETLAPIFAALGLRVILRADAEEIVCSAYREIVVVLISRRHALEMSQLGLDWAAGVEDGYTGKIECGDRRLGPVSLPALLGALRLEMYIERARGFRWTGPDQPIFAWRPNASFVRLPAKFFHPAPEEIAA
jgi:transcriptional regulator with XRE-family HTH domain